MSNMSATEGERWTAATGLKMQLTRIADCESLNDATQDILVPKFLAHKVGRESGPQRGSTQAETPELEPHMDGVDQRSAEDCCDNPEPGRKYDIARMKNSADQIHRERWRADEDEMAHKKRHAGG